MFAELGEIAAGAKQLPPFNQEKKFTVFKSLGKNSIARTRVSLKHVICVGMAIEDVYSAKLVYDLSRQQQ